MLFQTVKCLEIIFFKNENKTFRTSQPCPLGKKNYTA